MELVFPDAGRAGVLKHVVRPGGGAADVDVGVGDLRGVAGQPVAGTGGVLRQPGLDAGRAGAGQVEERGAAAPAEFEDFLAQIEFGFAVAAENDRGVARAGTACSPAGPGSG